MGVMRTKTGQTLTEEMIESMAAEAEAGFSPSQLRPLPVRRAEGDGPRVEFQVDRVTYEALLTRAREENRGVGEVARIALERYLRGMGHPASADSAAPVSDVTSSGASSRAE